MQGGIVVALTSIPPRFAGLGARLEAILAQRPDSLCLTLPYAYRRFPDWDGSVPDLPAGVTLRRAPDQGPATKFLSAFALYPKSDILIADDDCRYASGWLDAFRVERANHPGACIAASVFDSGRLGAAPGHAIVQGFGGMLLRPCWLGAGVMRPDDRSMWVDDLWLSAHLAAAGVPIRQCARARARVEPAVAPAPLQAATVDGDTRADLNRAVARTLRDRLGVWQ